MLLVSGRVRLDIVAVVSMGGELGLVKNYPIPDGMDLYFPHLPFPYIFGTRGLVT